MRFPQRKEKKNIVTIFVIAEKIMILNGVKYYMTREERNSRRSSSAIKANVDYVSQTTKLLEVKRLTARFNFHLISSKRD